MNEESLYVGATILLSGTHYNLDKFHMFIVLSDPKKAPGCQVLYVPLISAHPKCDFTCILDSGDRPFVKHRSCIHYARMNQRSEMHLLKVGKLSHPLRSAALKRVLDGVGKSPHSPPWAKDFLSAITSG